MTSDSGLLFWATLYFLHQSTALSTFFCGMLSCVNDVLLQVAALWIHGCALVSKFCTVINRDKSEM